VKTIGQRIKQVRVSGRLTQARFAEKIGVDPSYISKLEKDKQEPSRQLLKAVSTLFSCDILWLTDGLESKKKQEVDQIHPGRLTVQEQIRSFGNSINDKNGLLEQTKEILESGTEYAVSLAANVRSFHRAMTVEKEVADLREQVGKQGRQLEDQKKRLQVLERAGQCKADGCSHFEESDEKEAM